MPTASHGSKLRFSIRIEITTISRPYSPPIDRSISPATNRNVIPTATIPSGAMRRARATSVSATPCASCASNEERKEQQRHQQDGDVAITQRTAHDLGDAPGCARLVLLGIF